MVERTSVCRFHNLSLSRKLCNWNASRASFKLRVASCACHAALVRALVMTCKVENHHGMQE